MDAWRMRCQENVVAQDSLLDKLFSFINKDRPFSAVVLDGPRGIGKRHIAQSVAGATAEYKLLKVDYMSFIENTFEAVETAFTHSSKPAILVVQMAEFILAAKTTGLPEQPLMRAAFKCFIDRACLGRLPSRLIMFVLCEDINDIDMALFPKGFYLHLPVQVSSAEQRMLLMRHLTSKIEGFEEESLLTPGFSPADLKRLLAMPDINYAIKNRLVTPSVMATANTSLPPLKTTSLFGLDSIIEECRMLLRVSIDKRFTGCSPPKGILFFGPTGSGKTHLAMALARESGLNYHYLEGSQLRSKYFGATEQRIAATFRMARQAAPCILLIDHIDRVLPTRQGAVKASDESSFRLVTAFLTEMDGLATKAEKYPVIVIGMAQDRGRLDPAILRAGRLEYHFELPGEMSLEARQEFLQKRIPLNAISISDDERDLLLTATMGYSGADMEYMWCEAGMLAIRDNPSDVVVRWPHLHAALDAIRRRIKHYSLQ